MTLTYDLNLEMFVKGQNFLNMSIKENVKGEGESQPKYQIQNVNIKGQGQGGEKVKLT